MLRKLCSIFFIKTKQKLDTSTMGKFSSKLNYAAEAMLNFFTKTKQKLDTSLVDKFCSKLNYVAEGYAQFFYKNKTKT